QPPERVTAQDVTPKEIVFVIDTSGSMSGFPIEKAKEAMKLALDGLYPQDTFNLITFAGDTHILFPEPVPATSENLRKAQEFLRSRAGGGGTEMMKAIRAALDPSDKQDHIRIVCFMTDGYVGNDMEIIAEVQRHPNARVFSFGIGNSVNRFLLDKMAEHGRGEVEYVTLNDDGSAAAKRFHERVRSPLLTDISIDWGGLQVADLYPKRIPDLFSAKPLILTGRYASGGSGVIKLKGRSAGRDFEREIAVTLPESEPRRNVLATLWARARIDDLMGQDYNGMQYSAPREEIREAITQLGLEFRLMTQFTSFVAVEEMTVTDGGQPRRIEVPVEMPEGVSHEGVFGATKDSLAQAKKIGNLRAQTEQVTVSAAAPAGVAGGGGGGGRSQAQAAEKPKEIGSVPPPMPPRSPETARRGEKVDAPSDRDRNRSDDEVKAQQARAKMHPTVAALARRLADKNAQPAPEEARFVSKGKAELRVWLADKKEATIAQLRKLGFEIILNPETSKIIIGRIPLDKLAALAELPSVRYIAPVE
ncbi:MAG TPA: VWA domain-containing protein, partial [Blastocatellia bacterium]|nr:VWA domain-containing protein [Blastocatellia bacterium]